MASYSTKMSSVPRFRTKYGRDLDHPEFQRWLATPNSIVRFEEQSSLRRDGKPIPQIPRANPQINGAIDYSRRDVIPLNENNEVQVFMRFRDMKGR